MYKSQIQLFFQWGRFFVYLFLSLLSFSKTNLNIGARTAVSQAVVLDLQLCRDILIDFSIFCRNCPLVPIAHWVGKKGSEALGTGSNPTIYIRFLIFQHGFDQRRFFHPC